MLVELRSESGALRAESTVLRVESTRLRGWAHDARHARGALTPS